MASNQEATAQPFGWSPYDPFRVLLPRLTNGVMELTNEFVGSIGCNRHELTALRKILQSQDDYFEKRGALGATQILSQAYRQAVTECLYAMEVERPAEGSEDFDNFELLRSMHNILHLSDVFLPLLVKRDSWIDSSDPYDRPGAATASTVRYVRYHYMLPPELFHPHVEEMLGSVYPEDFGDGTLYWNYLEHLVLRGALERAWVVLKKHSYFVAAETAINEGLAAETAINDGDAPIQTWEDVYTDFRTLRDVLLRAPLPGGRNENFDDALSIPDDIDQGEYFIPVEELEVNVSDYRLWETNPSDSLGQIAHLMMDNLAMRKLRLWQNYAKNLRQTRGFLSRLPRIKAILAIMSGDFQQVSFWNWQEKVCSELLYSKPDIRPRHFAPRVRQIMEDLDSEEGALDGVMLSIMEGNAGEAVRAMWGLGGSSFAGLPSTLTTLLYCLFLEAQILSDEDSGRKVYYLCESASAIRASLPMTDEGLLLAIRLLIPYAVSEGHREIIATIAEMLEHHSAYVDSGARNLLAACRPLLEMKNRHVHDGCESIVLCRYRSCKEWSLHGDATHWLLTGVELEKLVLPTRVQGSCYRALVADCYEVSAHLLRVPADQVEKDESMVARAKAMGDILNNGGFDCSSIAAVQLLVSVLKIVNATSSSERARGIVACLADRTDQVTGVRRCYAPVSLHWSLLHLAHVMLVIEEERKSPKEGANSSAFDKEGIAVLMERLLQFCGRSYVGGLVTQISDEQLRDMRETHVKALARAYVAENAKRKKLIERTSLPKNHDIEHILTTDLEKHSLAIQERVIRRLLGDY